MYMDENDVRSPRDRVDGELLRRLLGENSRTESGHGCGCEADTRGSSRQGTRKDGCGCETNTRGNSRQGTREGSCGCDTDTRSGSRRNTREGDCGCGTSRAVEREVHRTLTDGNLRSRNVAGNGTCGCVEPRDTCPDGCNHECEENGIEGRSLAMVYAPVQHFHKLYDPQTGLGRGTVFRELDLPFRGDGISARGGNCRGS